MGRWLIDGNNVMGSRPDGWWRDRTGAKARLAAQVARWAEATDAPVVLFFDGRADAAIEEAAGRLDLHIAGSGRPNAADDAIVARAEAGDRVVTADRRLIARLPGDIDVVGPRHLLDLLDRPGDH